MNENLNNIERVETKIYQPLKPDFRYLVRTEPSIRGGIYFIAIVGILCCLYVSFINPNSFNASYGAVISLVLLTFVSIAIFLGRPEQKINENIALNNQESKYLLSLGYEVKKFYGDAIKTGKRRDNKLRPILLDAEKIKRHILIMATIGAGKTVLMKGLAEQHAILGGGGLIVDGKGTAEFAKEVYGLFASIGRENDFIHINFLDMNNTHTINPLLSGSAIAIYEILISLLIGEEDIWKSIIAPCRIVSCVR